MELIALKIGALAGVSSLLESVDILGFDKTSAQKAASLHAGLMNAGKPVNILNILIAGIVVANNEELLTRNTDHFSRVANLRWKRR